MPKEGTLGRLLLADALPAHVPVPTGPVDGKTARTLYQALAELAPDRFADTTKKLSDLSNEAGFLSGGYSFGPEHLRPTPEVDAVRGALKDQVRTILANNALTERERNDQLVAAAMRRAPELRDAAMRSTAAANNPLALQVLSGAKGKPDNVKSLVAGDTLYEDSRYNPIPFPVTSSFYEGLRPHEYYAGTHGARLAIILTKLGTASGGYLAKRMRGLTHRLVVSAEDAEPGTGRPDDPPVGLSVPVHDPDNEGALLAADAGGYKRNTVLDRHVLADLKAKGVKDLLVRSPIAGGPADGGVYARDVGVRERGGLSPVGDQVGLAAADSISEPATQSIIGCIVKGTLVRMADWSTKPIEAIEVGDTVVGADTDGNTFPVPVTRTYDNGVRDTAKFVFRSTDGRDVRTLWSTADHKVLGTVGSASACLVQVPVGRGCHALLVARTADGCSLTMWDADQRCDRPTYDIEVGHPDHLFVLANGLICSNSKHSGGVAGATKSQQGFPVLDKMLSIPSDYNGAVHARADGVLTTVRDAPQGGRYLAVGGQEHYVPPGAELTVKTGDTIEAGDPLTDGPENPAAYVEHKGIGEARKRFVDAFMRASIAAGFKPHRRNLELVARGFVDSVELQKEHGEHVPGDIVSYTELAHGYEPRPGHQVLSPDRAVGKYLERPALHHTIGTLVRPSVARDLAAAGIMRVPVHAYPPPFVPVAIRSHDKIGYDPDPLTRMMGSNLEKTLLRGVHRGDVASTTGTSFVTPLAEGTSFNAPGTKTRGWEPPVG